MTGRAGVIAMLLFCASIPCPAQSTGAVLPSSVAAAPGESFQIEVQVDVTGTGQDLGSYGAVLTWDPAVVQYTGTTAGSAPFDTPVINDTSAATGILRVADADPVGMAGEILIFGVTFLMVGHPCDLSSIDLSMSSLHASVTLDDLLPLAAVGNATVSVEDHDLDLQVVDPVNTVLIWNPVTGAASYDVIRIDPAALYQDTTIVHLGTVLCWEDDSLDTTTGAGTEAPNPDNDPLPPGQAFFYLVRARLGGANLTYGFTGGCARERLPDGGDCP